MSAYEELLTAVQRMATDAYNQGYMYGLGKPGYIFPTEEVTGRLDKPLRALLGELIERFDREAERIHPGDVANNRVALTWSLAAQIVADFGEEFKFSETCPELSDVRASWDWTPKTEVIEKVGHAVTYRITPHTAPVQGERDRQLDLFGRLVREARKDVGMSRKELARHLQLTKEEIRAMEHGESETLGGIRLDNEHDGLYWLSWHLGMTVCDLLVFSNTTD